MTDDNFHKLALSESFERVAKVAKEREAFNEAMEHVIHSSMPIDFERRYAMDNLIAQDADLIDTQPTQSDAVVKLLETMRERCTHPCRSEKAELGCDCDAARQAAVMLRQPIQSDALREALRNIQIEAEREKGSWLHLKRVIALNCKTALQEQSK